MPMVSNAPLADASLRRRGMTFSTWEGVFATVFTALTQGVFAIGFAEMLGASYFHYAVLAAIPFLASVVQVFTGYQLQYHERRKWFTTITSVVFRAVWAPVIFLPFFLTRGSALTAFLALNAVSFVVFSASANAWTGWMTNLVPSRVRGRYFGQRNQYATIAAVASLMAGGYFLDHWQEHALLRHLVEGTTLLFHARPDAWHLKAAAYGLVFLFGASMSVVCGVLLCLQTEPRRARPAPPRTASAGWLAEYREVLGDPGFRGFLVFTIAFNFLNGIAVPFWIPFMRQHVLVSIEKIAIFGMIGNSARIVALTLWGKWIDRFGSRPIMSLCITGAAIHPLFYVIASPTFVFPLYLDAISSGIMWAGIELATFRLLLGAARPERKEMYFAVHTVVSGLALAATMLIAGHVVDDVMALHWASSSRIPLIAIFVTVSVGRLASHLLLRRVHEPRAASVGDTARWILRVPRRQVEPAPEVQDGLAAEAALPQASVVEVKGIEPSTS